MKIRTQLIAGFSLRTPHAADMDNDPTKPIQPVKPKRIPWKIQERVELFSPRVGNSALVFPTLGNGFYCNREGTILTRLQTHKFILSTLSGLYTRLIARELTELKKEINTLCREIGREEPYALFSEEKPNPEDPNA